MRNPAQSGSERSTGPYLLVAFALFVVWSNSFIAASYLLGTEGGPVRFDWVSVTVARFLPIAGLCLLYCVLFRREETIRLLRHHPVRLVVCGLLGAPVYNLSLYYGQQNGVPPSVASLTTALLPLFVMLLAAAVLGERLTARKIMAFLVALIGLVIIALSKGDPQSAADYGVILAVTAIAPLSWAVYSILSKPIMGAASPLVWTYMTIAVGSIPLVAIAPWRGGPEMMTLPADGWVAVLYLSVLCTLIGYAVWSWLLRHLEASTVGFTVFFNPPLTTVSKLVLSLLFPAVFVWQLNPLELLGGGLSLAGLALALWPQR
jgi:drug/metabolite transporter (DMT)-like permease